MSDYRSTLVPVTPKPLGLLDRAAIAYLCLPLLIFVVGWLKWWVAAPLAACSVYAIRSLADNIEPNPFKCLTSLQWTAGIVAGLAWTILGGTDHWVFANADWYVRDAVFHDLVTGAWPVGYGAHDGQATLLRAPVAYYLPAALIGKVAGLPVGHLMLLMWTALGASIFLLQAISLTASTARAIATAILIVIFFSGMDIIGSLLNDGPHFRMDWNITTHIEWWAGNYQYSSMTTQLFWVPNHAIGAWLIIGLLFRSSANPELTSLLPILMVASALWSPLAAVGLAPFVAWTLFVRVVRERSTQLLHPSIWAPALAVGLVIASYLTLDLGGVPHGSAIGSEPAGEATLMLLGQLQFFLLEAGILGAVILVVRPTAELVIALVILATLPLVYLGPANDLAMRASIPSLTVLALSTYLALLTSVSTFRDRMRRGVVVGVVALGAVTPIAEVSRALLKPVWPLNLQTTLIGANCGGYPAHYVAKIGNNAVSKVLGTPQEIRTVPHERGACYNPALELMWRPLNKMRGKRGFD